jgi:hypothetical protein
MIMSYKTIKLDDRDWKTVAFDLDSMLECNPQALPFKMPTEVDLYACVMGENDEYDWYWLIRKDKWFYYVQGGCDYTGWDCQSWGSSSKHKTLKAALEAAPVKEKYTDRTPRAWLQAQIDGKEQIGVVKL